MAGSSLLMATPLAWAFLIFGGQEPEPLTGASARLIGKIEGLNAAMVVADDVPRIELAPRLSPVPSDAATASAAVAPASLGRRVPVVLPGYLLPVEGAEESVHAGG